MSWLEVTLWVVGVLLLARRIRAARSYRGSPLHADASQVSVIVPARNEAANLAILLPSLNALSPRPLEIIVVDDQSSDGTAQVAAAHGARVVPSRALPSGVLGKAWACAQGAAAARGEFLLFTDADTQHAPDSLGRTLGALLDDNADLLSLIPTHRVVSAWEKLQGVFHLLLLVATRAGGRERASTQRRFVIGQYLLFRRRSYEALGGHLAVAARLSEDLALAELARAHDMRVRTLFAPGALFVRMYPEGVRAFVAGWRRSFRDGMARAGVAASLELTLVIGALLGAPLWLSAAAMAGDVPRVLASALLYLANVLLIERAQRSLGAFSLLSALTYPLFVLVFVLVSLLTAGDSLRHKRVVWRGRAIAPA